MIALISIAACLLAYGLVIRVATRLSKRTRVWLIGGYALVHAASWLSMHVAAREAFRASVQAMHAKAQADIAGALRMDEQHGVSLSPEDARRIKERVRPTPFWSFRSFSPIPGVLVAFQSYTFGPLWGLGETWVYVFEGVRIKAVLELRNWVS